LGALVESGGFGMVGNEALRFTRKELVEFFAVDSGHELTPGNDTWNEENRQEAARDISSMSYLRSPFVGTQVSRVPGEEPMVPVEVLGCVLEFTIDGFVKILQDLGACRFCSLEMRINVINKHSQALSSIAELRRARSAWLRSMEHNPGITEMHLRAADRPGGIAIAVVLDEPEGFAQPSNRLGNILINDMRQNGVNRDGTILLHTLIIILLSAKHPTRNS